MKRSRTDTLLGCAPELAQSSPTRWYVVFCNTGKKRWWDKLFRTPAGFQHVYALRWDGWNWILFNPTASFTQLEIMPGADENALHGLIEPEATVLEVEVFRRLDIVRGRMWVGPMTCVEQIKALLGLPVGSVWTPWQLYRHLMEYLVDESQETESTRANRSGKRARGPAATRVRRTHPRK